MTPFRRECLAAKFGQDPKHRVGLRLALPAQDGRGVVENLHTGGVLGVIVQPHDDGGVGDAMRGADRTGHENNSVDQLSPRAGRHRLVKGMERWLVESLALDKRSRQVDNRGALRHDPAISCQAVSDPFVASLSIEDTRNSHKIATVFQHEPRLSGMVTTLSG